MLNLQQLFLTQNEVFQVRNILNVKPFVHLWFTEWAAKLPKTNTLCKVVEKEKKAAWILRDYLLFVLRVDVSGSF